MCVPLWVKDFDAFDLKIGAVPHVWKSEIYITIDENRGSTQRELDKGRIWGFFGVIFGYGNDTTLRCKYSLIFFVFFEKCKLHFLTFLAVI